MSCIRYFLPFLFCLPLFFGPGIGHAQQGHTYPRIGILNWGGGVADWYSRFDLVVVSIYQPDQLAYDIKSLNPNTIIMPTVDWNAAAERAGSLPDEFKLTLADGRYYGWYGFGTSIPSNKVAPNFSDVCPMVNGQRCNEYFAEMVARLKDLSVWDGVATDGLYAGLHMTWRTPPDVDLDRNGVPDEEEHGKSWVISHWNAGVSQLLDNLRDILGPNVPVMINSGQNCDGHPNVEAINGAMCEYWGYTLDWNWKKETYIDFIENAEFPHVTLIQSNPSPKDPSRPGYEDLKSHFRLVRFGLTRTMLGDAYFHYEDLYDAYHYYCYFFDEYELDLGYATTDMIKMDGRDVWVRFFDEGVSICNISKYNQTVTDADLQQLSGYNGPYFRFKGGQVPDWNDGSRFNSVALSGDEFDDNGLGWTIGDGIILVKQENEIHVTDIIIDNVNVGTSPGTPPPVYTGDWVDSYEEHDCYTKRIAAWITDRKLSGYAVAEGGSDAKAVFTPTIGLKGTYAVYEWHGSHYGDESSAVQYLVETGAISMPYTIDQKRNQGQWNFLGNFYFEKGTSGQVTVFANTASGSVIADAIKFEYKGDMAPDNDPPNSPVNLQTSQVDENSLHLSWAAPAAADDGDLAFYYQVTRDGEFLATTTAASYDDSQLSENTVYNYTVYAVDDAGNRSASGASASVQTLMDNVRPALVSATGINLTTVDVVFSERVLRGSVENEYNFEIQSNVTVLSSELLDDLHTVRLTTSGQVVGASYTVIVNDVKDLSSNQNMILANSSASFTGIGGDISIIIAADDNYQLYINGALVGSGSQWNAVTQYSVPVIAGKNVIAIHCTDDEGVAGLVARVSYNDETIVSDESWKVTTGFETGWDAIDHDDLHWQKASSLGLHGEVKPWSDYGNVNGMPTDEGVHWIWSPDNENDNSTYFRYTLRTGGDMVPPEKPTGLRRK